MLLIEGLLLPNNKQQTKKLIHQEINFKNEIWVKKVFFYENHTFKFVTKIYDYSF